MICKHILFRTFLNEPVLNFVFTQSNGFKHFCPTQIILLPINHLFPHSEVVTSIAYKH